MEYFTQETGEETFRFRNDVREVTVADDVREIPPCAFIGSEHLEEVHMPDSVGKIGFKAFMGCRGLRGGFQKG